MSYGSDPVAPDAAPQGGYGKDAVVRDAASEPGTTVTGLTGAVTRGLAPYAAGAAVGAAAGAPFAGVGAIPGAIAGAGAVGLTELTTGLYDQLAGHFGWPKTATPQEMTDRVLDLAKVKRPETGLERTVETATGGAAGAFTGAGAAGEVAGAATSPLVKGVAGKLAAQPLSQAVSGATGGVSSQTAAELGAGPVGQTVAGMVGAAAPAGAGALVPKVAAETARTEIRDANRAGYVFPPAEVPELGDKPTLLSRSLGAPSGKIKLQQDASTRNQINTNQLAARDIGLHPDTHLGDIAFDRAKLAPAAVYQEVSRSIPEIRIGEDSTYKHDIGGVGGAKSEVEKYFPDMKDSPPIQQLRDTMLMNETVPTQVAMKKIADLRMQANTNFHVVGDAQAHALGLAQKQAANALEDAVERQIKDVPGYYSNRLDEAKARMKTAAADVLEAHNSFVKNTARLADISDSASPFAQHAVGELQKSVETARDAYRKAVADYDTATREVRSVTRDRDAALRSHAHNQSLLDRYRAARQRFAKIYMVEAATNRTTGNVSAPGLARAYNKGAPLTGDLQTIAEAANAAPKSMQIPELFGRSEDLSVLDFYGSAIGALHGNPVMAVAPFLRAPARRTLLSGPYQRAMVAPDTRLPPSPAASAATRALLSQVGTQNP